MRRASPRAGHVCIELDEKGNATDYLLVAYTEKYFGRRCCAPPGHEVCPAPVQGRRGAVALNFGYEFTPDFSVPMSSFDASSGGSEIQGGARL